MCIMRWSLVAVRICMVLVSIAVAALILLTTVPLAMGGLDIDLPDEGDDVWTVDGSTYSAEMTIGIYNGGYFDITDFDLDFNLTDTDGYLLAESVSEPTDLKAGEWTDVIVGIEIDVDNLPAEKQAEIVFNGTDAIMGLGLDAKFGLGTMRLSLDVDTDDNTIEIPPMITEMKVDPSDMSIEKGSYGYRIALPYSFSSSDYVTGEELSIHVSLSNATKLIGSATSDIVLSGYNSDTLYFPISNQMYDHLLNASDVIRADISVTAFGVTMEKETTYYWSPFVSNLEVVNVYVDTHSNDGTMLVDYRFDASYVLRGQDATVNIIVTDSSGNIAFGSDHFTIQANNYRSCTLSLSDGAMSRITGTNEDWTVTFTIHGETITTTVSTVYHRNGGA